MVRSLILSGRSRYILLTKILNVTLSSQKLVSTSSGKIYLFEFKGRFFEVDPNWSIGYTIRTPYFVLYCFLVLRHSGDDDLTEKCYENYNCKALHP
jgi:hypothetical protein